jgi:DNA replication protein DnaC
LKLSTAAKELDEVAAKHKAAVSLHWVSELLERELDARKQRALQKRIERAEFPELATLEAFDWRFNPKIDKDKIEELAQLEFIRNNRIALFLGKPGTGKTHLALALGLLAVKADLRVYCTSAKNLAYEITLARAKNSLDVLFKKILSSDLWIVDNWGVVSMSREIAEEVFDLFDRRKYNSAMILTSNRDLKEWSEVFPDPVLANATIDRMFDRAEIVIFEGKSYRLKGRIVVPDFKTPVTRKEKDKVAA